MNTSLKEYFTYQITAAAICAQSHTKIGVYPEISTSSCGIAKVQVVKWLFLFLSSTRSR
jgi:hypothetical protein